VRKDLTARDTVMYSIVAAEWPDVRRHLDARLERHGPRPSEPRSAKEGHHVPVDPLDERRSGVYLNGTR
jgi:hypothetical protein